MIVASLAGCLRSRVSYTSFLPKLFIEINEILSLQLAKALLAPKLLLYGIADGEKTLLGFC